VFENPAHQPEVPRPVVGSRPTKGFWAELPKDEESWLTRRELVGISTLAGLVEAICELTHFCSLPPVTPQGGLASHHESAVKILREYGLVVSRLEASKIHATQISNFSIFLFVCLSIVALEHGASLIEVNKCSRAFLESNQGTCKATPKYLAQLRSSVRRVIKWASDLSSRGLAHRAWELLFLCMMC
jgi:hypothetical protein